jgi:hypothetical protein
MSQQGVQPFGETPIRQRIGAGEDTPTQRVLASASGKVTPENAGHKIDVQHPDFTEALRVSSTTSGSENVMAEAGVDISGQHSKLVGALSGAEFDCVVTSV